MASVVAICNMALLYIGQDDIQSLEEGSKAARLCSMLYAPVRDQLLEEHHWNFATRHASLALIGPADGNTAAFGWDYAYQLPPDCLRVRRLAGDAPYEVREKGVLLTNVADAQAVLTVRVVDAERFPALFIEVLARKLSAELAVPLTASGKLEQSMMTKYLNAFERARLADASEGEQEPTDDNAWLRARLA